MSANERRRSSRSYELHLGGRCELSCATCDCRDAATSDVDRYLERGGARVVLRGAPAGNPRFAEVIRAARARGVVEVVVRTNALAYMTPEAARAFAELGADAALVPLFASVSAVHDRVAGRPEALAHALVGMRSLAAAGTAIDLEIPILAPKIQDLAAVVALAHRAVPGLRSASFFVTSRRVPPALAPPSWIEGEGGPALAAAIRACRALGVKVKLGGGEGVPLCALRDAPDLHDAYSFDPKARIKLTHGATYAAACSACAVRDQCPGVAASYRAAHGEAGLVPYAKKPPLMYAQRSAGSPVFTAEHRRAASKVGMLVLRPTVNCNQDCPFCSANETSSNVWTEPGTMLRAIARAARRGVERVSFSGGEPTLARDLVHYIAAASRLGVSKIEIVTNAVLLDSPARALALREAGLTHAFVSLHAHDERLSRRMTQKMDDHGRTLRGIENLLAAGVETVVNHVITAQNYPYLTRFVELVRATFCGEVMISFAFVTPQYKALEDGALVPRLSEVMPYLRRALHRALQIGQAVVVGSRQGVPPCFLGEFAGWSDVLKLAPEAASEDAPQKQRAAACDTCKFTRQCTGLWRPYVARYGLAELVPVAGAPFTDEELHAIHRLTQPSRWGAPMSFEGLHPRLRDLEGEALGRARYETEVLAAPPIRGLPLLVVQRSRPIRVALVGSGRQARRLALAARNVAGVSIDAVISPHAPEADLRDFGGCPSLRSLDEAILELRPEAVIIAAATAAHHALARAALAHGVPVLLEKPLARTEDEALDLVRAVAERPGAILVPAHNMIFAAGLDALLDAEGLPSSSIAFARRVTATGPEAMRAWSRAALAEVLYHALSLVGHAAGGGAPTVTFAHHQGDVAPERVHLALAYPGAEAEITLDFAASAEETRLSRRARAADPPAMTWRRAGPVTSLRIGDADVAVPRAGSDVERMLAHFRDVVLGKATPRVSAAQALDVMRGVSAALDALDAAGAPFDRAHAPRHVASAELAAFPRPRSPRAGTL